MRKSLFIVLFILLLILILIQFSSKVGSVGNDKYDLELKIRCPVRNIQVGDEIPIVFTITNKGTRNYEYEIPNGDRSGRMREYQLQAKDNYGKIVADPRKNLEIGIGGGLSAGMANISTDTYFNCTIALNRWSLINSPGKYKITGTYFYYIPRDPNSYPKAGVTFMDTIQVKSRPIVINVKSRGHWSMGGYIKKLQKDLKATETAHDSKTFKKREEIIQKLAYTCDERSIPTLMELLYSNQRQNDVFWAMEGLRCYLPKTASIKKQLINIVRQRGLGNGMSQVLEAFNCDESIFKEVIGKSLESQNLDIIAEAAIAAQEHPSDDFMPALIAIAKGTKLPGLSDHASGTTPLRAIYAIANNRTDEGVEALKALLNDTNEEIRNITEGAIKQAYRHNPKYPKESDEEYTATLVPIAIDPNHPRQMFFIDEILRTRSEEEVKAIKNLLENPESGISIAETDSGVNAIRSLLKSPNKELRNMTEKSIKFIYKTYPGWPLRDDDFPDEFRENPNERKKKIMELIQSWQN